MVHITHHQSAGQAAHRCVLAAVVLEQVPSTAAGSAHSQLSSVQPHDCFVHCDACSLARMVHGMTSCWWCMSPKARRRRRTSGTMAVLSLLTCTQRFSHTSMTSTTWRCAGKHISMKRSSAGACFLSSCMMGDASIQIIIRLGAAHHNTWAPPRPLLMRVHCHCWCCWLFPAG